MPVVIVLLILIILAELGLLCLRCRRGHPAWALLRPWRYAHRGLRNAPGVPENSMAAFRRAIDDFYGAELDVHLMADGNLAVIHDSSLKRTAGADVCIEDLTAADLDNYHLEGTGERIPLLSEVLALFEGRTPLIVELKPERGNFNQLTAAAVGLLDQYHVTYCIESFDPRCLMWLRHHRPEIVRGQLAQRFGLPEDPDPGIGKGARFLLSNLLMNIAAQPDFIAYRFRDRDCLAVKLCRRIYKVQEVSWTITDRQQMAKAEQEGNLVIFEGFDPRA